MRRLAALILFAAGYGVMAAFGGSAATAAELAAFVGGSALLVGRPEQTQAV